MRKRKPIKIRNATVESLTKALQKFPPKAIVRLAVDEEGEGLVDEVGFVDEEWMQTEGIVPDDNGDVVISSGVV